MRFVRPVLLALLVFLAVASVATWPKPSADARAPLLAGAQIDPSLRAVIERSCRDCHSEATQYPWYSYIAPVSFLIRRDVKVGREHLNLSRWSEYSLVRRERCLSEIANQVRDGEMPLGLYTSIHPHASLSKTEAAAIFQWTQTERRRLIFENAR